MSITILTDDNNDLYLDDKNNFATSKNRLEEIKQLVNNNLQTFLGEIYTNTILGVDYFNIVLNKFVSLPIKISEITNTILKVTGVIGINNINYSLNTDKTEATYTIEIQTDAGNITLDSLNLLI